MKASPQKRSQNSRQSSNAELLDRLNPMSVARGATSVRAMAQTHGGSENPVLSSPEGVGRFAASLAVLRELFAHQARPPGVTAPEGVAGLAQVH